MSTLIFAQVLGEAAFAALPPAVRRMHAPGPRSLSRGEAEIDGPDGMAGRLIARLVGFPTAAATVPAEVAMVATAAGERWTRQLGRHAFASDLQPGRHPGEAIERFGPLAFTLALAGGGDGLRLAVRGWRLFGLPMPGWLRPGGDAWESEDQQGRFTFAVEIRLPLGLGRVCGYRGWLVAMP
jgi:hypothetical protein